MTAHELAVALLQYKDLPIDVSVDVSKDEHDSRKRAFGEIDEVQYGGGRLTLICIGNLNYNCDCPE